MHLIGLHWESLFSISSASNLIQMLKIDKWPGNFMDTPFMDGIDTILIYLSHTVILADIVGNQNIWSFEIGCHVWLYKVSTNQ